MLLCSLNTVAECDLDLFVRSRSHRQLLAEQSWKGSLCGNAFAAREKCQRAIISRGQSLFGGAEIELFSGVCSVSSVVSNISDLLALKDISRRKLTRCRCAGSLDGEAELLLLDSLSAQFSRMQCCLPVPQWWLFHQS